MGREWLQEVPTFGSVWRRPQPFCEDSMKIYSTEAVLAGKVPTTQSFADVTVFLSTVFAKSQNILGACIIGSVAKKEQTRASDIDCIVVFRKDFFPHVLTDFHAVNRHAEERYVPLSLIITDGDLAQQGLHTFEQEFYEHIVLAIARRGIIIKNNPIQFVCKKPTNIKHSIMTYVERKLAGLDKALALHWGTKQESEGYLNFLHAVTDVPIHTARKALFLAGGIKEDDSSAMVEKQYPQLVDSVPHLAPLFSELVGLRKAYAQTLEKVLASNSRSYKQEEYELMLCRLHEGSLLLREFLSLNATFIKDLSCCR